MAARIDADVFDPCVVGASGACNDVAMTKLRQVVLFLSASVVFATLTVACGGAETATPSDPLAARGKALVATCTGCHSIDGDSGSGPTWKGLAGSQVQLTNGKTVAADDAYLTRSILDPGAELVAGYSSTMSLVVEKGSISEDDARAMVAYIKTLD